MHEIEFNRQSLEGRNWTLVVCTQAPPQPPQQVSQAQQELTSKGTNPQIPKPKPSLNPCLPMQRNPTPALLWTANCQQNRMRQSGKLPIPRDEEERPQKTDRNYQNGKTCLPYKSNATLEKKTQKTSAEPLRWKTTGVPLQKHSH